MPSKMSVLVFLFFTPICCFVRKIRVIAVETPDSRHTHARFFVCSTHTKARFVRTFGLLMNPPQRERFEMRKAEQGWRVVSITQLATPWFLSSVFLW